jgi:PAS domain S-box-containing protein
MRNKPTLTIRQSLISWFVMLLVLSGALLWIGARAQLQAIFLEQGRDSLNFEVEKGIRHFRHQIEQPLSHIMMIRDSWAIEQYLLHLDSEIARSEPYTIIEREVENMLKMYLKHVPRIRRIRIIATEAEEPGRLDIIRLGDNIYRQNVAELPSRDYSALLEAFSQRSQGCGCLSIHFATFQSDDSEEHRPIHQLLVPIHHQKRLLGIVVADHDVTPLLEELRDSLPWPAAVKLFNSEGDLVLHPLYSTSDLAHSPRTIQSERPEIFTAWQGLGEGENLPLAEHEQHTRIYRFTLGNSINGNLQGLLVEVEHRHLIPDYSASLLATTLISLLVLLIGILLALVAANSIARPILRLNDAVLHYTSQHFTSLIHQRCPIDELERLRTTFISMHQQVEAEISQRSQLAEALRESNQTLETRVIARTQELEQRNSDLQREIDLHTLTRAQLHLARQVMNNTRQAVVITDADNRIIEVNDAYTRMSGFTRQQAIGQRPSIGKSGRQDAAFYAKMWQTLIIHNHWEGEIWDRRANGEIYPKQLQIDRLLNERGEVVNYVAIFEDITHKKATEEELEYLTHYDQLTGLSNRTLFRHRLEHEFEVSRRHQCSTGLVLINLDRFHTINDSYGYLTGDQVLREIARRLDGIVRKTDLIARGNNTKGRKADTVSRFGGDEFSVILSELKQPENAAIVARRMMVAISQPIVVEGQTLHLTASLGIATYPDNSTSHNGLINCAERAVIKAKQAGGNVIQFYSDEMNRSSEERLQLEIALRHALNHGDFILYYQPKIDLNHRTIVGMEALIRWKKAGSDKVIPPCDFIPVAEESGLIVPIGTWVLQQACHDTQQLSQQLGIPLRVAVNLSAKQFRFTDLPTLIGATLEQSGLPPSQLELEITESMAMEDVNHSILTMQQLNAMGLNLAIDDFGTGYSSLAYLKRFPVQILKIDRAFVSELEHNQDDAVIASTICSMGHQLSLKLVAEGIESEGQLEFLRQQGCHCGQGYFIARPMPLDALRQFIQDGLPQPCTAPPPTADTPQES